MNAEQNTTAESHAAKVKRRRGIYLLPNLFTTASLFAGFFAITEAINQRYEIAAIAIFVAMILDGMDGRVARLTNTESAFGAEYDSMADLISFGAAPALVVYIWSLAVLGKPGWIAAFVHCSGAALRLARFNTQIGTADKRYFQGLPSPSAAAILAGFVWFCLEYGFSGAQVAYLGGFLSVMTGLLMVSNFRYYSFKDINFKGRVPFVKAIMIMLTFAALFISPSMMSFVLFLTYAVSGPVLTLVMMKKRRSERKI